MTEIPIVDVGPLRHGEPAEAEAEATATAIDAACRELGAFFVVGHGVDDAATDEMIALAHEFFGLGDDEKHEIAMPRAGRAWRGWFPLGGELTAGEADLKEGIYFGAALPAEDPRVAAGLPLHGANLFPRRPAGLRSAVLRHMAAMTQLGQVVLEGVALGLGLPRRWFADGLTADPLTLFRIFRYPPEPAERRGRFGVGEHTDYGLLTLLGQDSQGGLQVRAPGRWVDVAPLEGAFVCNLGDMLERLTGGRYRSAPHRVRNLAGIDRLSFPFFLDPGWDRAVDRLPIVPRPPDDGGAQRWDHMSVHGFTGTYGEYIQHKVAKVFPALVPDDAPGRS